MNPNSRPLNLLFALALMVLLFLGTQETPSDSNLPATDTSGFKNPRPVKIEGLPLGSGGSLLSTEEPFLTRDGRFLLFNSGQLENRKDLHFAERRRETWFYRGELGPGANSASEVQGNPTMDQDFNLYFIDSGRQSMVRKAIFSPRTQTLNGLQDLHGVPLRRVSPFSRRVQGNMGVEVSADGTFLLYSRATWRLRKGTIGELLESNLGYLRRRGDRFQNDETEAQRILGAINTRNLEYAASISVNGLELFLTRLHPIRHRDSPMKSVIIRSTRADVDQPFGPGHVIEAIGDDHFVEGPAISADGKELFYHQREGSKFRLFKVTR